MGTGDGTRVTDRSNVLPFGARDPEHEREQVALYAQLVPLLQRLDSLSIDIIREYLDDLEPSLSPFPGDAAVLTAIRMKRGGEA